MGFGGFSVGSLGFQAVWIGISRRQQSTKKGLEKINAL